MALVVWIGLGLVAGFIASRIINQVGNGVVLDTTLGVAGAVLGGWFFSTSGIAGVNGPNPYSFLGAIIGAIAVLVVYHLLVRPVTIPR